MRVHKLARRLGATREKLAERNAVQRWLARKMLPITQSLGFNVIGDHFYEPIPNMKYIRDNYSDRPRQLPGFLPTSSWEITMEQAVGPYIAEYLGSPAFERYGKKNWFYTGWDAAYYYCLIRSRRPRAITEVGRGLSTWIAGAALAKNALDGYPGELVSIDPYHRGDNATECTRIITTELQQISSTERKDLLRADILFVDSSHVGKWGSDVLELFESWIPNVTVNNLVHIHDIFTPYDYPRQWLVEQKRFWNEQYLFESFVAFNSSFQIECPLFYLSKSGASMRLAERTDSPELTSAIGTAMWLKRTL